MKRLSRRNNAQRVKERRAFWVGFGSHVTESDYKKITNPLSYGVRKDGKPLKSSNRIVHSFEAGRAAANVETEMHHVISGKRKPLSSGEINFRLNKPKERY